MINFTGPWDKAAGIGTRMQDRARLARALGMATEKEGHFLRGMIVKGIASQAPGGVAFRPLSPATLALRSAMGFGGSKALIRTGALRAGVTVVRLPGSSPKVFVGILRSAKSGGGGKLPLANVAAIQEFGAAIKKTERMRRFIAAKLRAAGVVPTGAGKGKATHVIIPPRPFLRPVFAKYAKPADVKRRFYKNVADAMGGDLGTGKRG